MPDISERFADDPAHLDAELARLDILCRIRLRMWRAEHGNDIDGFAGLYVSDEEVERLLNTSVDGSTYAASGRLRETPSSRAQAVADGSDASDLVDQLETASRQLRHRIHRTLDAGGDLRLMTLADRFGLERRELDALLITAAPALDAKYGRIYAYLHDDIERTRPTVDLVLQLLAGSRRERLTARQLFDRQSPLVRSRLVRYSDDRVPVSDRVIHVDERVVAFLLGSDVVDPALADVASVTVPDVRLSDVPVDDETASRLDAVTVWLDGDEGPEQSDGRATLLHLHGPPGCGASRAVEALCTQSRRGSPLLTVNVGTVAASGATDVDLLPLVEREARLRDATVHITDIDLLDDDALATFVERLDTIDGLVWLTGRSSLPTRIQLRVRSHAFVALHVPTPAYDWRVERWRAVAELPEGVDPADLASKFRFTAGQITDAVETAEALARAAGRTECSPSDIYAACRAQCGERLNALARNVVPVYGWDDIVLPQDVLTHLHEVAVHVENRGQVYTEWGFEGQFSLGNGVTALFSGPSGTGKTMAAEILAGVAGLDLFKIDLSRVVSKYIGETEKNLGEVFDEAEDSNAVLLFDEADALFGKRSEVTDAHDRYANIEVNYLLQRIEEFDGIVILTTNFESNVDDAFRRRITHHVEFPRPDREARAAIWRRIFPVETPVEDLDVDFLAGLDLTGGNIRNVALNAAFLAAADGSHVGMDHVLRGVKREFRKTGHLIDPDEFGSYYRFMRDPA